MTCTKSQQICVCLLSFIREYLDPVVKADQCAQYVDDNGIAANNATDVTRNLRAVFKCIHQAGLKLTFEKGHCGVRQVELLGRTSHQEKSHHKLGKFKISLTNVDSQIEKSITAKSGLRKLLQKLYSQNDRKT